MEIEISIQWDLVSNSFCYDDALTIAYFQVFSNIACSEGCVLSVPVTSAAFSF